MSYFIYVCSSSSSLFSYSSSFSSQYSSFSSSFSSSSSTLSSSCISLLLPFLFLLELILLCQHHFDSFTFLTFLSQPNNNHNPNNKTTITVVGLRLSNRWEYHPHPPTHTHTHHTNSKLHDRAEIEQNSENKSCQSILGDPKTVFEPCPNPKNTPLGPQKVKNDPKIKSKSNVRI